MIQRKTTPEELALVLEEGEGYTLSSMCPKGPTVPTGAPRGFI